MARPAKTTHLGHRPKHPNYAQQATQQAAAAYQPQIHAERRDLRGQEGSLRTMGSALQNSLSVARHNVRHAGLQPDDLAMALKELAFRGVDVGAGTQLQIQTARQDTHGNVQDLLSSQSAARSTALSELRAAGQEREQELADEARHRQQDFTDSLRLKEAERKRGLGQYADDGGAHGLSDADREARHNAAYYAKQAFDALRASGKVDEDPKAWDDETWRAITGAVHKQKGVDSVDDAGRAVSAIRDHFVEGGDGEGEDTSGGGSGSILPFLLALGMIAQPKAGDLLSSLLNGQQRRRR